VTSSWSFIRQLMHQNVSMQMVIAFCSGTYPFFVPRDFDLVPAFSRLYGPPLSEVITQLQNYYFLSLRFENVT